MKRLFTLLLSVLTFSLAAQNANDQLKKLYAKYSDIPNYKVSVKYEANNEAMGFSNTQNGELVVQGDKYKLTFGPNETWMSDGKVEYIGTKEEDHSELIMFCAGENAEVPINYGQLFTFYNSGVTASMADGMIKLNSTSGAFKEAFIQTSGGNIKMISVTDDFGMKHQYTFTNFSTSTGDVAFTINRSEYAATIDERQGCK